MGSTSLFNSLNTIWCARRPVGAVKQFWHSYALKGLSDGFLFLGRPRGFAKTPSINPRKARNEFTCRSVASESRCTATSRGPTDQPLMTDEEKALAKWPWAPKFQVPGEISVPSSIWNLTWATLAPNLGLCDEKAAKTAWIMFICPTFCASLESK